MEKKVNREGSLDKKILNDFHGNEVIFNEKYKNKIPIVSKEAQEFLTQAMEYRNQLNHFYRVFVEGGGCSGFVYGFKIESLDSISDTDIIINNNPKVVIDEESIKYMYGATIAYENTIEKVGITIKNPGAQQSCGCGVSFNYAY